MQENSQKVNSLDNLYFFDILGQTFIDAEVKNVDQFEILLGLSLILVPFDIKNIIFEFIKSDLKLLFFVIQHFDNQNNFVASLLKDM